MLLLAVLNDPALPQPSRMAINTADALEYASLVLIVVISVLTIAVNVRVCNDIMHAEEDYKIQLIEARQAADENTRQELDESLAAVRSQVKKRKLEEQARKDQAAQWTNSKPDSQQYSNPIHPDMQLTDDDGGEQEVQE